MNDGLKAAHRHCRRHRAAILSSRRCGCFCRIETFAPAGITAWTDDDDHDVGQTALCPRCGMDAVIGDASGIDLSNAYLIDMRAAWSCCRPPTPAKRDSAVREARRPGPIYALGP